MSPRIMRVSDLTFRTYLIASAAFDGIIIPSPCLVDGLYMTTNPIAPALYTFFDAQSAGGTQIFAGTTAPVQGSALRIRCNTALYLQQSGAGTLPQWVIIAAILPDPDVLILGYGDDESA